MALAVKNTELFDRDGRWDVLIDEGKIKSISRSEEAENVLDAEGKVLSPGFFNTHTHAAMTLFRGVADDKNFWDAWPNIVWPLEENLTAEDVYWGTKLACLEMIKSGTVAFSDMYFFMERALDAVEEMGMKAVLSYGLIDQNEGSKLEEEKEATKEFVDYAEDSNLVEPAVGPHSVYTVSKEGLKWSAEYAEEKDILIHTHLAETEKERNDFMDSHDKPFTEYLDEVGMLNEKLTAAHCVWLEDKDHELLAENDATVCHNASSNMKLGVGKPMDYGKMKEEGVDVTLATDGAVSNNNLDMIEEAKTAALQQKMSGDATLMDAEEVYDMMTVGGATALNFDSGVIEEGKSADLILIEKDVKAMPDHDLKSNLIYSMDSSAVKDVIIDGSIVMRDRKVDGEEQIIEKATKKAKNLASKVI